jgi:hypothetical protein
MSGFWLLLLPVVGFAWYLVGEALHVVPDRNEDFVFC